MPPMYTAVIKPNAEASARRRHPWIFSGAVAQVEPDALTGETLRVGNRHGQCLGFGAYSPDSQIRIRFWTFDSESEIDASFFRHRLAEAIQARSRLFASTFTAFRLVNAESDGLPGLIVDRYGDFLVCQFLSAGVEFWKKDIVNHLADLLPVSGIYERSDSDVRLMEGLPLTRGMLWGTAPPELIRIQEGDLSFWVDIRKGHKTGFYLDQRENRILLSRYSQTRRVLNCFAYTGGFGLAALKGGAETITNLDSSAEALELAGKNLALNKMDTERVETICDDAFQALRKFRDQGRQFDVIVLDPPKFAHSAGHIKKAARGYKDINLLAMKLLTPGGHLFTFSCSGHIMPQLFQKIVADAAIDAQKEGRIVRQMTQSPDHPVALNFPEGLYLKGLVCRIS